MCCDTVVVWRYFSEALKLGLSLSELLSVMLCLEGFGKAPFMDGNVLALAPHIK